MFTSLSRSPEQSRRYLKNFDREDITKDLCSDILNAIQVLTCRKNLSPKELQERVIQVQRVLEGLNQVTNCYQQLKIAIPLSPELFYIYER